MVHGINTPAGWTYANIYGAEAGGVVSASGCGVGRDQLLV